MRHGAGPVAEDLHLDVARAREQLLDVDLAAAEGSLGLGAAALEGCSISSAAITTRVPRPPPPASALMIIAPPGPSDAKNACASSSVTAWSSPRITGTAAATAAVRARALSPNSSRCSGVGPDEGQARLRATAREVAALGEEAIARMDCIAAGGLCRRDHGLGVQIGRRALARQPRLVGHAHMQAARVVLGMHGDGRRPRSAAARAMRMAISPRLAIRSLVMGMLFLARYRRQLHGLG